MSSVDFSIYFVSAKSTRDRQFQMRNDTFGSAVRGKIEEACAQNLTSCLFNPSAWNAANPTSLVPTDESPEMLKALEGKGFKASFAEGVYTIDWSA